MIRRAGASQRSALTPGSALVHARTAAGIALRAAPLSVGIQVVLSALMGVAPVAGAWLTKLVIDGLADRGRVAVPELLTMVLALAAIGVSNALAVALLKYFDAELGRSLAVAVQDRLYRAIDRLAGLAQMENPRFHDRLQMALQAGQQGPSQVFTCAVAIGQGLLTIAGFLATLALLNRWMLAVVAISALPSAWIELNLSRGRARSMERLTRVQRREFFYQNLLVRTDAAKELRLFGLGDFFRSRMLVDLGAINAENRRLDRQQLLGQGALAVLGAMLAGGGLVWAIVRASAGQMSVGDVSVFIAAVAGVQSGLRTVIGQIAGVYRSLLLFDHYQQVVSAEPDLPVQGRLQPVPPLSRGVELRDVWFRYADDHPWILRGVDLVIPHGRAVALVGLNGAGKSTVVKLLCRFYDPTRGAVLWDGMDLRSLPVPDLRRRIGAVFQDFMDYDLSAAENIAVGDLSALGDWARIGRAARAAGVHEVIAGLPSGPDTLLSRVFFSQADKEDVETGVVLSGGQWQRVALARALLRDQQDLLILDEPSAGLDAEAEHEIHEQLRRLRRGRTSLLISHRLSTIREADNIIVLRDGRVTEQGPHAALMELGGAYARLFRLQARGYQTGAAEPVGAH